MSLGQAEIEKSQAVASAEGSTLGLSVRPMSGAEQREAHVDHGLVVERASGPARMAGVKAGDVLLAINGRPVKGVEQVRDTLRERPRSVALLIQRDGQQIFVPVEMG
jgi:serine protease Do